MIFKTWVPCWINNYDSLPPGFSAEVSYLITETVSHSLTVLAVSLQNTIGQESICSSHTILCPFFLKGNYLFVLLLSLSIRWTLWSTDTVLQTTGSVQINTFIHAALKFCVKFLPIFKKFSQKVSIQICIGENLFFSYIK